MTKQEMELLQEIVTIGKELSELRAENAQLKERVVYLEKQNLELIKRPSQPIVPQPIQFPKDFYMDKPLGNTCSKCGLKLEGVMGYVCTQPRCPTGLGGAWS